MLSRCFLYISVGVGAFVIGLSQISSFFSFDKCFENVQLSSCFVLADWLMTLFQLYRYLGGIR